MSLNTQVVYDPLLQAQPARVSAMRAGVIASECFGVLGAIRPLAGERDLNFQLACADGSSYLLKISHPLENPQVVDFQNQALLQIQHADPELPVQRVYAARDGRYQAAVDVDGQQMLVRLLSFVDGQPLHQVKQSGASLRRNLGDAMARLDIALAGYQHPASGHELLWDMQQAARLRPLLVHIDDEPLRALASEALDAFEVRALPRYPALRRQVIHNDLNPHNVIVDPQQPERVLNILDFGDMVHAPLINEVGVAAAYQVGHDGDVLAPALDFVAAYHRRSLLREEELEILGELIATRLVMTIAITAWRASLHPENRDYILRNVPQASASLRGLAAISSDTTRARIHQACRGALQP
ncbi:phosphotransferase [Phytopseudomonas punonensis]|uniref:Hydroxylysine kinase n=1 Tax=Phytopseudomonas punonensis TaxID=1220495 RepID=A0A1M7JZ01_9GAMM|nr:phosphotransferase [Pseudomonas punonensis]SHM58290.1 Ser/Thr protein kinase RdoA involved in Cpx stress response, MazF antagonist [Pseudomonas punonensis]